MRKMRGAWAESFLDEDEQMDKVMEDDKQHALVCQEDQPLCSPPRDYRSCGEAT